MDGKFKNDNKKQLLHKQKQLVKCSKATEYILMSLKKVYKK